MVLVTEVLRKGSFWSTLNLTRTQNQVKCEELPSALHSFCQQILTEHLLYIRHLIGAGNPVVYNTDMISAF